MTFIIEQLSHEHLGPISLSMASGELLTLRGKSGSGKSQLLRALADLDEHNGEVALQGDTAASMPAHQWRCRVALLPAESQWWHDDVIDHFPADYHFNQLGFTSETATWKMSRLSTGEKQRLALLRLLVNEPKVLLLDEPTASLDPHNTHLLEELICNYQSEHQAIVIWVSHDLEQIARLGGRQAMMLDGQLQEVTP